MPSIVPIVEGRGEVQAAPILLRRILWAQNVYEIDVARPVLAKRNQIVLEGELERKIAIAERDRPGAAAVLVLLDADDDCAARLSADLLARARAATDLPSSVVLAVREYEAWFLGCMESLRSSCGIREDAVDVVDPEAPRDAKGRITQQMVEGRRYVEVADQPALTQEMDLVRAEQTCRSFRKLVKDVHTLAAAI